MGEGRRPSIEELFHAVLSVDPQQRAKVLRERSGGDQELERKVLALLEQDALGTRGVLAADAERFIDASAARIGRYDIVRELGSGGMGTVFLARQTEPVQRLVAVKRIRADFESEQIVQRFELERQTLALMTHPCIAQIYDGGTTEDRLPYFVMEYVDGRPLTEFCDNRRFGWRRRLELFARVCNAVHHAHQKGIVHRDLKPGNVLVTDASGTPQPKVIDFGIVRALSLPPGQQPLELPGGLFGSLPYMSPEQADEQRLGVDSRADIYALGVVLFELLVGVRPREPAGEEPEQVAQFLRLLRQDPAPAMAARLAALPPAERERVASERSTTPREHLRLVRGDLAWIVRRALASDPAQRYAAASELENDVRRRLAGDSVLAAPQTVTYRAHAFLRRYRLLSAMAGLLVVGLLAVLWSLWNAAVARDQAMVQRARALTQLDRARGIEEFLDVLLFHADPVIAPEQQPALRELVARALPDVERMFADRPAAEAGVRAVLGQVFMQAADPADAELQLQRAVALLQARPDADAAELLFASYRLLMATRVRTGPGTSDERAVQLLKLVPAALRSDDPELRAALQALVDMATGPQPDSAAALAALRRTTAAYHSGRPTDDLRVIGIAIAESGLLLQARWRMPESAEFLSEVEALARSAYLEDVRLLPMLRLFAGRWLLLGAFDHALRMADELIRDTATLGLRDHWLNCEAQGLRGIALVGLERHDEADRTLQALRERLGAPAEAARWSGSRSPKWSDAICGVLAEHGRLEAFVRASWQRFRAEPTGGRWWIADTDLPRPVLELARGIVAAALADAPANERARLGALHGALLLRSDLEAEAQPVLARACAELDPPDPELLADFAIASRRTGKFADAEHARERLQAAAAAAPADAALRARAANALARVGTAPR